MSGSLNLRHDKFSFQYIDGFIVFILPERQRPQILLPDNLLVLAWFFRLEADKIEVQIFLRQSIDSGYF